MRSLLVTLTLLLTCAGCVEGEPCDIDTYEPGCKGKSQWTYCANKDSSGFLKPRASVQHIECKAHTECVQDGEVASCVAAPAERCDVEHEGRCVDGLSQRCWPMGVDSSGALYWQFVGLSCE